MQTLHYTFDKQGANRRHRLTTDPRPLSTYREFQKDSHVPSIVLYSPDIDLCVSLQLLFESTYNIITTTDMEMFMMMIQSFHPDVVIADAQLTSDISRRFLTIKKISPSTKIVLLYASFFENSKTHEQVRGAVDSAFSKPVDLSDIITCVHELTLESHSLHAYQ